jgi:tetratricopeptide (TPR) repeat protein
MTPNSPLTRAILLLQQSRYELAEQELRRVLAEAPHDPQAHALLAVALAHRDQLDEAEREAEQAIVLAPDWAHSHYCRSIVLERRKRFKEAEAAAREAVRLDPGDADNYARVSAMLLAQRQWQPALQAALDGLTHDAEHAACSNLRTMALTQLNRKEEALASVDAALSRDPDNALAHCNKGWALLHQGQPRGALEHFREALRLEPNFEYARMGLVEALKAHNPIYRWMLAYFLWMARLSGRARWGVILGGYFGYRLLGNVAEQNPALAPWILPLLVAYIAFVALTWFAMPLFNLLLRFNRFGRHALSRDQRIGANWFAACLTVTLAGVAAIFYVPPDAAAAIIVFGLGMGLPLTTVYHCDRGWPRQAMSAFAGVMAAVGVAAIAGAFLDQPWGGNAFMVFLIGVIATPWVANALVGVTPTR